MHAEILLSCQLVRAFYGVAALPNLAYVDRLSFISQIRPISEISFVSHSIQQYAQHWFDRLKQRGIQEMRLDLMGSTALIYTQFSDAKITAWQSNWQHNELQHQWEIDYQESLTELVTFPRSVPEPNRNQFLALLQQLEHLAQVIGETQFAQIFHRAAGILAQTSHSIRELQQQLFSAAQQAWVFGGMGSWNDAAPYLAAEQGLEQDYQHLTEQLHRQIRQALMYAVNFAKTS
ncbi:hypothetical protein [Acinetobacter sp. MB5]|uniref:hypothetical protein n=1 Tax=Acinetobacter sp. MB5 TaxID=2069438 RepID=UPI000DCFDA23|nr:hypothetical protein [Acinetobacter sp. MB5]